MIRYINEPGATQGTCDVGSPQATPGKYKVVKN